MKIAIQAADLDHERIDGTRVYILNMLRRFGKISPKDDFFIYHRDDFNPSLEPPRMKNYHIKKIKSPFFWTQVGFALDLWCENPNVLWMPMHNLPFFRRKKMRSVVTVHDLAYKHFPQYFAKKDLRELNFLGDHAIRKANRLIAVSESTKRDILNFFPEIKEKSIRVIHHGFDSDIFSAVRNLPNEIAVRKSLNINNDYLIYTGAIQPRKNLEILIKAFEIYKKNNQSKLQLVIAGGKAWLWEDVFRRVEASRCKKDIIITGYLNFENIGDLVRGAQVYVFPSLYEGFGIPVLEAFSAGVPVIVANNSSLVEVGGEAASFFDANNAEELADKIEQIINNKNLQKEMIQKGFDQIRKFSWDKCAKETLDWISN